MDKVLVGTNNVIILLSILLGQVFGVATLFFAWVAILSAVIMLIGLFTKVAPMSIVLSKLGVREGAVFKEVD